MEMSKYMEAVEYIQARVNGDMPKSVIVLGSGLGVMAEEIVDKVVIPYKEIPHFPLSTVAGHAGELIIGNLNYAPVIAMNGRFHFYEGYDFEQITFPIRVFSLLGVKNIILTNAAGGINFNYAPGDFMIIRDHINFSGVSPLRGKNMDEFGPRFPDMTNLYDPELSTMIRDLATAGKMNINEGVYAYLQGPNFETPAEIKALRTLGADAVGMSTVPEAIVARHCGIKVAGISCITNMAAGILDQPLSHEEVNETAALVRDQFKELIKNLALDLYTKKQ